MGYMAGQIQKITDIEAVNNLLMAYMAGQIQKSLTLRLLIIY